MILIIIKNRRPCTRGAYKLPITSNRCRNVWLLIVLVAHLLLTRRVRPLLRSVPLVPQSTSDPNSCILVVSSMVSGLLYICFSIVFHKLPHLIHVLLMSSTFLFSEWLMSRLSSKQLLTRANLYLDLIEDVQSMHLIVVIGVARVHLKRVFIPVFCIPFQSFTL